MTATALVTLAGNDVSACRVQIPAWGIWWADVALTEPVALSGAVELRLSDVVAQGTIISGGAADGRASYRIAGGRGGWGRTLPAKSYVDTLGVRHASVLRDLATETGESLPDLPSTRGGQHYARANAPATAVLHDLAPRAWYVGLDGVTRLGQRDAVAYTGAAVLTARDHGVGIYVLTADTLAGLEPGAIVDPDALPAVDVEIELEGSALTARVYTSPRTSRVAESLARLVDALDPRRRYRGVYEYRVVQQIGERLNLQIVRASSGMADLLLVPVRPGTAGLRAHPAPGSLVLVAFVDADPSRPAVIAHGAPDALGWAPSALTLAGDGDRVALASEVDARLADVWAWANAHTHAIPGGSTNVPTQLLWPPSPPSDPGGPQPVGSSVVEVAP